MFFGKFLQDKVGYLGINTADMKTISSFFRCAASCLALLLVFYGTTGQAQDAVKTKALDQTVQNFLKDNKRQWRDMNVPSSDGQMLYDIIIKKGYTRGLEIGTSTGHSAIWIAWAFSKTGGKLITIEIDEDRHKQALENLQKAGLLAYVDARLANAHDLVKTIEGPFDFVFSDADKGWYTNYFKDVDPKLTSGGCFTAHNIRPPGRKGMTGTKEFLDHIMSLENYTTTVDNSGGGLSISYKN